MAGRKMNRLFRSRTISRKQLLEGLESRLLLSVTVKQVNGDLLISGDSANNHIAILEDGSNHLFVYGDASTAITGDGTVAGVLADTNAGGGREFSTGQFQNIFISMGSGADTVEFAGLQTDVSNLIIDMGNATSGGDTVQFGVTTFVGNPDVTFGPNSVADGIAITTGNGADVVMVDALTTPALTILTGAGGNTIGVGQNLAVNVNGPLTIAAGNGANVVTLGGTGGVGITGALGITTGNGGDSVTVERTTAASASITTGSGNDTVTLAGAAQDTFLGDLTINTGDAISGADVVNIGSPVAGANISGNLSVTTGNGNDAVNLNHVIGRSNVSIQVGGGTGNNVEIGTTATVLVTNALVILGGNASNAIDVNQLTAGSLTIDGGNGGNFVTLGDSGTVTIAGTTSIVTGSGADGISLDQMTGADVRISTGADSDTVLLATTASDSFTGNITIQSGDITGDADSIQLGGTNTTLGGNGFLSITTGNGDDDVTLDNVSGITDAAFVLGSGDNTVSVGNNAAVSVSGNFSVTAENGSDAVTLNRLTAGSLAIDGGDGNDTVLIGSGGAVSIASATAIQTGNGIDTVRVDGLTGTDLQIATGDDGDTVTLGTLVNVNLTGNVSIDTGNAASSEDFVTLGNTTTTVTVGGSLSLTTGNGDDTVTLNGTTATGDVSIAAGSGVNVMNVGLLSEVAIANGLTITSGTGTDTVRVNGTSAATLSIDTQTGSDAVSLTGVTVAGDYSISSGNGNQTLKLSGNHAANVTVSSDLGSITFAVPNVTKVTTSAKKKNGDFSVTKNAHSVTMAFHPTVGGTRNESVVVATSDPQNRTFTLNLQGTSPVISDLTPDVQTFKVPARGVAAGSRTVLKIPVKVTYTANVALPANAKVNIQIFAHDPVNNTDTLLKTENNVALGRLLSGKFKTFTVATKVPANVAAGTYAIRAVITDVAPFAETNTTNNTATSLQTFAVT